MKNRIFPVAEIMFALALPAIQSLAQSTYEPYTFTTLAGGGGFTGPDMPGTAVRLWIPAGVAVDTAGYVYVGDTFNHTILKVSPAGVVTTLAGLPGTFGSADGTGSDARFYYTGGAVVDSAGNVFVSDGNQTIRKVTPEGVVTTLAGLAGHPGNANGTNSDARFNLPGNPALDEAGNIYVVDSGNNTIRKLSPVGTNWVVTTIAGLAGVAGSANGTNSTARFNFPQGLAIDSAGSLYVADSDNFTVRKVTPVGTNWVVTTIAGRAGSPGSVDGTNSVARFNGFAGLAVDAAGIIYVADTDNNTIRQVTLVGTDWVVTTLAGLAGNPGSVDGTGNEARFDAPYGVVADNAGNIYVTDTFNDLIRKMTLLRTNWVVTTLAGLGGNHGSAGGNGSDARFNGPASVAVDNAGNVYVADQINHSVRKVTSAGTVTTLAGLAGYSGSQNGLGSAARFNHPDGVAVDGAGNVYVGDYYNGTIRKVTPAGVVTTLGSNLGTPYGVALDTATNIYLADSEGCTIRKVTRSGSVSTLVGRYGIYGSADGIGTNALFNNPRGLAVDATTNIYVADTWNHTIRKVTPARVVMTIAGQVGSPGGSDGVGAVARFNYPSGMAVDSVGALYVADTYNNTIRKLTLVGTNWVVTTLGGMSGFYGTADGTGSSARFANPNGIAVDATGNLYVADFYFNTIRKGYPLPKPRLEMAPNLDPSSAGYLVLHGLGDQNHQIESSADLIHWTNAFVLRTDTNGFAGKTVRFTTPQQFFRAVQQ
jgi:sugar lactone lactonase YvrE